MNQSELKISIVTPSFNQCEFIEETILSILNQNYPHLELIIIDGGSTDNSVETIKKYASNISFWVSESDRGQSHAINKGFEKCTGDIVCWLNSDDLFMPNTLNEVAQIFKSNSEVDFILGETEMFNHDGVISSGKLVNSHLHSQMLAGAATSQPSYFFRKSLLNKAGHLNEELHFGMDYDFFLRLTLNGKYQYFDRVWSRYRLHSDSKTETSQLKFAAEWNNIFVSLLKSQNAVDLLKTWKGYGFDTSVKHIYSSEKIELETLEVAAGFALYHQAVFRNQGKEVREAVRLLNILKTDFKDTFTLMGVDKYLWKLRLKALLK